MTPLNKFDKLAVVAALEGSMTRNYLRGWRELVMGADSEVQAMYIVDTFERVILSKTTDARK